MRLDQVYAGWLRVRARFSLTERQRLFGLTILIGGVCGLVAVAFHLAIEWVASWTIEPAFRADSWMVWVIAVPAAGALIAGIAMHYAPNARGSGIPQVKHAYATSSRRIRVRDSFGKFAISSLQVGTGSSLGREGPTVQICAGVAKALGRLIGVSTHNLRLLLPVGAAAGIAAAFNAPIAAVTFTIEEVVGNLDQTLLSGAIVAAALAAVVERSILGDNPVFSIPQGYGLGHAESLIVYAALGIAAALISVAFSESMLWLRERLRRPGALPLWSRPMIGGLVTGAIAVLVMQLMGSEGITGGGYTTLVDALSGNIGVDVLLALGACKLVATAMAYSSGGAGGIFAPTLFIGAMLGGAFGALDVELFGHGHSEVGAFALVGMGAVFAGTVRAPITSVLIIIEMTGGYGLTLPLMISNMMAYGLARHLRPAPIYEALLAQDGIHLHTTKKPAEDHLTIASIPLLTEHAALTRQQSGRELLEVVASAGRQDVFVVLDGDRRLIGTITLEDLTALAGEPDLGGLVYAADLMHAPNSLRPNDTATRALEVMASLGVRQLPVTDADDHVLGLIDEAAIARAYLRARAVQADPNASGIRPM